MKNTLQRYGLFANRKARNAIFCVKKHIFASCAVRFVPKGVLLFHGLDNRCMKNANNPFACVLFQPRQV